MVAGRIFAGLSAPLAGGEPSPPWRAAPEFTPVFLPPYRCWRSFAASAVVHGLLIPLVPWLLNLLPDSRESALGNYQIVTRSLEIQMPELWYVPSGVTPGKEGAARRKPSPPVEAKQRMRKPDAPKTAPRRFELPELARRAGTDQTVLQPQYPPDLPLQYQVRLPNVVLWNTARLPKPEARRFVKPGSPALAAPKAPVLEAPPRLELPNREVAVSDLRMSGGVVFQNPALPRPPATTVPVRVFRPAAAGASGGVSLEAIPGDPVNLIALSPSPAPMGRSIIVPAGNQAGGLPGPPGEAFSEGASASQGGNNGQPGGSNAGASESGGGETGSGSGSSNRGSGAGSGIGTGSGSGMGAGQSGSLASGGGQQGTQVAALANLPAALSPGVAVKVIHPNNAVFDVVIHSTSSGALPDTTGILSGKPVYTVYLHVGYERDWILQYCRPAAAERQGQMSGNVLTLGVPAPVKAPYPMVTVAPPVTQDARTEPILVHGFLDTLGRLKALKLVHEPSPDFRQQLFSYLEQWQFRPGTRDGVPVLLEILLVIPANRV